MADHRVGEARSLHAPDGARVELTGEGLDVFDPAGRLLIRYRDGGLEVAAAQGDLVLASATGRVRVAAATDFVVEAKRDVHVEAARGFRAEAGRAAVDGEADAQPGAGPLASSRITLDARRAVLAAPALDVRTRTAQIAAGDATILARRIQTSATRIATTVEELEVTAGQVVERARDVVQEVSGVLTSRIGRVRALVKGVYSLRSKRTEMKSTDDTAIDGRRVLLG
jgi:hypothetical protein